MDIVSKTKRSQMMAGIRSKNTRPELLIRKALHAKGFRFRLHVKDLPGKPDLVLKKYKVVIFVHGCFWHGHNCYLFKIPQTRTEFWLEKIQRNIINDEKVILALQEKGWRIANVWECALRGRLKLNFTELIDSLSAWILTNENDHMTFRS